MEALLNTPFYQQVLQQGRVAGLEEGVSQGRQEGRSETTRRILATLLPQRFGALDAQTQAEINDLEADRAEALIANLYQLDTVADLQTWLARQIQ